MNESKNNRKKGTKRQKKIVRGRKKVSVELWRKKEIAPCNDEENSSKQGWEKNKMRKMKISFKFFKEKFENQ